MSSETSEDIEQPTEADAEQKKAKSRMTVTKLGHKIDDIADVLDIMHNEIQQMKEVCKGLVEIQKELLDIKKSSKSSDDSKTQNDSFRGMFG